MLSVESAIEAYLRKLSDDDCSVYHLRSVRSRLGMFARWPADGDDVWGERPISEVSRGVLREHFRELERSRMDGTMAGYSSTHKAFWKWCKKKKWVKKNLGKKLKKYSYEPRARQAAPPDDVDLMSSKLFEFARHRKNRPRDIRDALFVSLCLDNGGRRGAVLVLRWCDMERALERPRRAANGRVVYRVTLLRDKTGTKVLRFFSESAELFEMWRSAAPLHSTIDPVFVSLTTGKRLHPDSTSRAFVRLCGFVGIPTHRSQAIRKRLITDVAVSSDIDVASSFAGHSNISTTRRHYKEHQAEQVDNAAARVASARRGDGDFRQGMKRLFGVDGDDETADGAGTGMS